MATNKKNTKPAPKAKKTAKTPSSTSKAVAPKKAAAKAAANKTIKQAAKPAVKPAETEKKVKEVSTKKTATIAKKTAITNKPVAKATTEKNKTAITAPKVESIAAEKKSNGQPKTKEKNQTIVKPVQKKSPKVEYKEVKPPKTSVKTAIPYQPDYKPLEQRNNGDKSNEPLVRYSDTELNEFRELIAKKLEAAKKELAYLQGLITRKDDMGGDETDSRYMTMEDGSMSMEREQLSQMASRQITYIDHLEKAVIRIENKTYGICRVTGKLIDKARLRAVPHATLSLEAKMGYVRSSNDN